MIDMHSWEQLKAKYLRYGGPGHSLLSGLSLDEKIAQKHINQILAPFDPDAPSEIKLSQATLKRLARFLGHSAVPLTQIQIEAFIAETQNQQHLAPRQGADYQRDIARIILKHGPVITGQQLETIVPWLQNPLDDKRETDLEILCARLYTHENVPDTVWKEAACQGVYVSLSHEIQLSEMVLWDPAPRGLSVFKFLIQDQEVLEKEAVQKGIFEITEEEFSDKTLSSSPLLVGLQDMDVMMGARNCWRAIQPWIEEGPPGWGRRVLKQASRVLPEPTLLWVEAQLNQNPTRGAQYLPPLMTHPKHQIRKEALRLSAKADKAVAPEASRQTDRPSSETPSSFQSSSSPPGKRSL